MIFGSFDLEKARGAILAHSLTLPDGKLNKGRVLSDDDIMRLSVAGINQVTVAILEAGDLEENLAAEQIGQALLTDGVQATAPVAGRVNLIAKSAGLFSVDAVGINQMNTIDEAITLATLPDHSRVQAGQMVATVKIIPYAAPRASVEAVVEALSGGCFGLQTNQLQTAGLILTCLAGMKDSLFEKAVKVTQSRLNALDVVLTQIETVEHNEKAVAEAIKRVDADLVLILGASATSDRADVAPAALIKAGGELHRFGMPVDPGNLLFVGAIDGRPLVGLPGCARSPALNGADWVLQRLVAGKSVNSETIAAMGIGGLLKEIPIRRQPRASRKEARQRIEIILLAAGASRRMKGEDKLLRHVDGRPLLHHAAKVALASSVDRVQVVIPSGHDQRRGALAGLDVEIVETRDWQEGMSASLRAGLANLTPDVSAVVVMLADMPEITTDHVNKLIAAFDAEEGREVCRAQTTDGKPGHPVLFSRRFFENLMDLTGDKGARELLKEVEEFVVAVPTEGDGAVIDLDTPDAWAAWENNRKPN